MKLRKQKFKFDASTQIIIDNALLAIIKNCSDLLFVLYTSLVGVYGTKDNNLNCKLIITL